MNESDIQEIFGVHLFCIILSIFLIMATNWLTHTHDTYRRLHDVVYEITSVIYSGQ